MADPSPGFLQRLVRRFVSARRFAAMEAESRSWKAICPGCGAVRSIWDMGGIRYKASGNPRRRIRCPGCGRTGWHEIRR